jgi:uncharacterized protein GlcG (DUF336 family)
MRTKKCLELEDAQGALAAGLEKSRELGIPMSLAVVDEAGTQRLLARMDGASLLSLDVALRKAYTSAVSGYPTGDFFEAVSGEPSLLAGLAHRPDLALFAGGIPVLADGEVIGAVGVSGGHYTDDHAVASAMLESLSR